MTGRIRFLLGLSAVLLLVFAIAALAFALLPVPVEQLVAPVTPALLSPPGVAP